MKTKKLPLLLAAFVFAGILACVLATTALADTDPVRITLTANTAAYESLAVSTDILGRTVQQILPVEGAAGGVRPTYQAYRAQPDYAPSSAAQRQNPAFRALKLVVYYSKAILDVPYLRVYSGENLSTGRKYVGGVSGQNPKEVNNSTIPANTWTTLYFDLSTCNFDDTEYIGSFMLFAIGDKSAKNFFGETIYIGYMGLFDTLANAQADVSDFEGALAITDVQLDGASIGNVTETTVPLADPSSIPVLTVTGTGNADNVVITNGTLQPDGTATSTVTKNGTPVVTIHFDSNASAASAFTNSVTTKAGYTAASSTSSEKAYAIIASVQLDDSVDLSQVTAVGFYGYVADSDTAVVALTDAASLATLGTNSRRFYAVIYDIPTVDTEVILKPFVTVSGTTTAGTATSYVPNTIGADTYYGTEANIETYFAD